MTDLPKDVYSLVADIGGTNTRVALARGAALMTDTIRRFRNAGHPSLESVLARFLGDLGGVHCRGACVAIAGPVRNGRGTLTNLDWTIDEATLARATRAETVAVLNDLQAQGHALDYLGEGAFVDVIPGPAPAGRETKLVIGVGTGFNVAPVHHVGDAVLVPAAESGHASLPVRTEEELALARHVEAAHGFAAIEDVLSGRGLERIHGWLGRDLSAAPGASAAEIMRACDEGNDARAREAVMMFVRLLGRVAGNQALDHLPFGGVFLAGGVARAMAPHMPAFGFAEEFRAKGRFGVFMRDFPVRVIVDDFAALIGSSAHLDRISRAA